MPKKYTLSQFQTRIFSEAALPSLTPAPRPPAPYPFTCPWQTATAPLAAHAAVARGELPHDDRPAPETCTFCDQPAAPLPTADWPMCLNCFNAIAAPEELCDPLF